MQKCFYHAKSDAVTTCLGCKMPVCVPCRDAGAKGFCDSCMKKVSALGEQITDMKKTGMVQGSHKATMVKTAGRPTSQKNVTYCFQHFDVIASGQCPSCNRSFCPECLNASGLCTHCARQAGAAPAPPRKSGGTGGLSAPRQAGTGERTPGERPSGERPTRPAPREPRPAQPPMKPASPPPKPAATIWQPATFFVVAIVVFLLIAAYKLLA